MSARRRASGGPALAQRDQWGGSSYRQPGIGGWLRTPGCSALRPLRAPVCGAWDSRGRTPRRGCHRRRCRPARARIRGRAEPAGAGPCSSWEKARCRKGEARAGHRRKTGWTSGPLHRAYRRDTARAMSRKNVETAWLSVDAFNQRDPDAFAELCVPEVEIVPLRAAMEGTVYRGNDAVSRFFAESDEAWEDLKLEDVEIREVGGRVLAFATLRARGRA